MVVWKTPTRKIPKDTFSNRKELENMFVKYLKVEKKRLKEEKKNTDLKSNGFKE